ncbi:ABC transporter permease [Desulforamulus reducens]|nr:ABC transporter permease [Desulforamulus reducens]
MIFSNITQNKVRTFLTTLGVIVGTATIFLVVAIGKGAEAQVNQQYSKLNVGTIIVMPATRGKVADPLTKKDAQLFLESENITQAFPMLRGNGDINYNNYSTSGSFMAIQPAFQGSNNLTIEQGRAFEEEDEQKRNKCVVIGAELANTLTENNPSELLGQSVSINNRKFEVIGIYNRVGDSGSGMSYDDAAFVPYSAGERFLLGTRANPTINVQAKDIDSVQSAIEDITNILNDNHRAGGADQFRIMDAGSRLAAAQESAKSMSLLLLAVAAVVLVVSGIGIMNVMFVTVRERTREIGTLKAIGAKKQEILNQFLIEAVIISLAGGIIGVIMGFLALPVLRYFGQNVIASVNGVLFGLVFSVVTGVFFGFYPAWKAADLSPLEALRYE